MSRHSVAALCALAVACSVPAGRASAQDGERHLLDEIVVTATRREESVRDVARSISVVDRERIRNATQQLGIDEALAGIPGLYMQNRYNFSQDLSISLRGFGSRASFGIRGIRVYVDGIPETLPDGQAQVDSIDLGSAGRIEVLRGPASALYGNASGGVIAIETEEGGEPFVEAGMAAGELGFRRYGVKTGGVLGEADYLVNVSRQEIDGFREHSFAEGSLVNARVSAPLGANDRLTLAFNHTDQPLAQDPGAIDAATAAANPRAAHPPNVLFDAGEELSQQRLGAVYERELGSGTLLLRNYYVWRDFANRLPFVNGGAVDLERFFWGAGVQYALGEPLPDEFGLTLGVDWDSQDDDRLRFDNEQGTNGALVFDQNEHVKSAGVYAVATWEPEAPWRLSAGLRYDRVTFDVADRFLADGDDSGEIEFDQVSPSLGASVELGEHVLFASFASSFETPTTTELANPSGAGGFNPALEPQRADNFEVGLKGERAGLYYELAAFHIELSDELVPFELPGFPGRTFFANAGESDRNGVEAAVSWRGAHGLGVDASWTWSDFEFERFADESGTDFGGRRLPGVPEHFGFIGLTWQSEGGLYARLESRYSGEFFADNANAVSVASYTVTSFRASRAFDHGPWRIRPYVGVNNLFDERYPSHVRANAFGGRYFEPAPGRNAYAGIDVRYAFGDRLGAAPIP